eukprot:6185753-Pleurochrysis_carterae.AAC.2
MEHLQKIDDGSFASARRARCYQTASTHARRILSMKGNMHRICNADYESCRNLGREHMSELS